VPATLGGGDARRKLAVTFGVIAVAPRTASTASRPSMLGRRRRHRAPWALIGNVEAFSLPRSLASAPLRYRGKP